MTEKIFYTDKELAIRYSISRESIWRWARIGEFPKPIKLNGSSRWNIDQLLEWEKTKTNCDQV
jgi:prophage regulatory protein